MLVEEILKIDRASLERHQPAASKWSSFLLSQTKEAASIETASTGFKNVDLTKRLQIRPLPLLPLPKGRYHRRRRRHRRLPSMIDIVKAQ